MTPRLRCGSDRGDVARFVRSGRFTGTSVPMLNRRALIFGGAGLAVIGAGGGDGSAARLPGLDSTRLRGSIDAIDVALQPGSSTDQSEALSQALREASDRDAPVFLPAGTYVVSRLVLPPRVRLSGVPGASRLVFGGDGHLMMADTVEHLELTGLVFDGANRRLADYAQGLVEIREAKHLVIDNCRIDGSSKHALTLERVQGRVERSAISGAAEAGIWSVDGAGVQIVGNSISDCANGGILVHRWQKGEDATLVSGNRVQRIAARSGGTGQNGNGINTFRAGNVVVSGNVVSDCAFSAIRANSSDNILITGNSCARSGETAIYSEFAFEGAAIANNIVDGAANGISIVNFNEGGHLGVCTGNVVRNLSTTGPYPPDSPGFGVGISVETDTAVTGNVVENAPRYGLHIGWGAFMRNVTATGNVIRKATTGIAVSVVEGAGPAVIADNVIEAAPEGAIVGYRWADPATPDLARSGAGGFPNLTVERNRVS